MKHWARTAPPLRLLQSALGALWIFDGLLQLEPSHYSPDFFGTMLRMNMAEPPTWLWNLESAIEPTVVSHALLINLFAVGIQLGIGLGLLYRRTVKIAIAVSIPWALCVWLFGESAGGLFGPGASALTGAPGAALLYAIVALILWPVTETDDQRDGAVRSVLAELSWVTLWVGTAALESEALNRLPTTAGAEITSAGIGQPSALATMSHAIGDSVGHNGVAFAVVAGLVQATIGLLVLPTRTRRTALLGGMTVGIAYGIVGQDLGGIFSRGFIGFATSGATDPGTGPIVVLLALTLWFSAHTPVTSATTGNRSIAPEADNPPGIPPLWTGPTARAAGGLIAQRRDPTRRSPVWQRWMTTTE